MVFLFLQVFIGTITKDSELLISFYLITSFMYKEIKSLYYLSKLKYFLKNPLVWFVIIDWALTQYIVGTGIGFESNPIVDYLGFNTSLIISLAVVSFIPKGFFRLILIAWYCFIISRHILIILGVI